MPGVIEFSSLKVKSVSGSTTQLLLDISWKIQNYRFQYDFTLVRGLNLCST